MEKQLKEKYRRYIFICTEVKMNKRDLTPEERQEITSIRKETNQSHQEIIKIAGGILQEDME